MALVISEFDGVQMIDGSLTQVFGKPTRVTSVTGAFTVGDGTQIIRIQGTGSITWDTDATPEPFEGVEFRRVKGGEEFTVA